MSCLGYLIEELKKMDQDGIVPFGFGCPMSWRGDYSELAFEPIENAKISDMLRYAESAFGEEFNGYKGGVFKMHEHTLCYIAEYGTVGNSGIGKDLIGMWNHHVVIFREIEGQE